MRLRSIWPKSSRRSDVGRFLLKRAPLLRLGLEYVGERRDATWALLKSHEITEREFA